MRGPGVAPAGEPIPSGESWQVQVRIA